VIRSAPSGSVTALYDDRVDPTLYARSLRADLVDGLAPAERASAERPEGSDGRPAAVLVPVVATSQPTLIFTKRARELKRHAGEISFPGGLRHAGDRDLLETALRETEEELGLARQDVDVLGALDAFLTYTTGFWVVPYVGWLERDPLFTPSPAEIDEVIEVPVATLSRIEQEVTWQHEGGAWTGFVYEVDGHTIWGATGRMVHEFLEIVRREPSWQQAM
jgi:8-oxo-dGTP pyrophosphatase MutT (NUDIX family)